LWKRICQIIVALIHQGVLFLYHGGVSTAEFFHLVPKYHLAMFAWKLQLPGTWISGQYGVIDEAGASEDEFPSDTWEPVENKLRCW